MSKKLSQLELEFARVTQTTREEIKNKLDIAYTALAEAEKISEREGIPFHSFVSPISQSYIPSTFNDKWKKVDTEKLTKESPFLSDLYMDPEDLEYANGWQHSAVC